MAAGKRVKEEGAANDLIERIAADPAFGMNKEQLDAIMDPKNFIGCAAMQTQDYLDEVVAPILKANEESLGMTAAINV
jgi:adenylosuccinate lyase